MATPPRRMGVIVHCCRAFLYYVAKLEPIQGAIHPDLPPERPYFNRIMSEIAEEMVISNTLGMHLRPAQKFVQIVLAFACDVHVQKEGQRVNAKSIMGLLTLAAGKGSRITVVCEGDDAADAIAAVRDLVDSGFGED